MKDVLKQVIGGIILIVVAPIVTYILGWWPFIIKVSKGFIIWLSQAALVYNWLYILLLLLASYSLFGSKGLLLFLKRRKVVARYSCLEEVFVLFILTKVDGQSLCLEDIANGIRCNNIRTLHALDKLQEKWINRPSSRPKIMTPKNNKYNSFCWDFSTSINQKIDFDILIDINGLVPYRSELEIPMISWQLASQLTITC